MYMYIIYIYSYVSVAYWDNKNTMKGNALFICNCLSIESYARVNDMLIDYLFIYICVYICICTHVNRRKKKR